MTNSYSHLIKSSWLDRKIASLSSQLLYKRNLNKISNLKVAVHIHLYYLDLLDEFISNLKNIPIPFDIYITLVDRDSSDIKKIFDIFPNTKVFTVPNLGRDLAGLVEVANHVDFSQYDCVIKIHTKKSLHTGNEQTIWRKRLIESLIGSKKQAAYTISQFSNQKIGMIGSHEDLGFSEYEDEEVSNNLYKRLEIEPIPIFFKGTMFAIRGLNLKFINEKNIQIKDFKDGKLNYAMERIFGAICFKNNLIIKTIEYKKT